MQLEIDLTNELLRLQIMTLLLVFHVVREQLERLLLFEVVVHLYLRHKIWIQIVVDALGAADLRFYGFVALLLERIKNNECVRLGERVEIRQVSQREGEAELLF